MRKKEFERMKGTMEKGDLIQLNFKSSSYKGQLIEFTDKYFVVSNNLFRFNYKRVCSLEVLGDKKQCV